MTGNRNVFRGKLLKFQRSLYGLPEFFFMLFFLTANNPYILFMATAIQYVSSEFNKTHNSRDEEAFFAISIPSKHVSFFVFITYAVRNVN